MTDDRGPAMPRYVGSAPTSGGTIGTWPEAIRGAELGDLLLVIAKKPPPKGSGWTMIEDAMLASGGAIYWRRVVPGEDALPEPPGWESAWIVGPMTDPTGDP